MSPLTRRSFVRTAGGLLAAAPGCFRTVDSAPILQCHTGTGSLAPGALPPNAAYFPAGVWSGDALPDGAVIGTRCRAPRELRARGVELRVYELHAELAPRLAHSATYEPDEAGFVYADVRGLTPHAVHRYVFRTSDGARSAIGWVRTAPPEDATPVVHFVGTSCTNVRFGSFPSHVHAARCEPMDFWIHAGDHAYCEGARTADEFRERYAAHWSTVGLRALHAAAGSYVTWDDHEVANNWSPETVPRGLVENARRVMFEHAPIRRDRDDPFHTRLWRSYRWGRTLELFVLDCRGERRRRGLRTPEYVSREQLEWVTSAVRASPARFKLVVNSVPVSHFGGLFEVARLDCWLGYPEQREAFLRGLSGVRGMYLLSGDFHIGIAGRVERSGPYSDMHEFLLGPGGSYPNPAAGSLAGPQWDFVTSLFGYTRFTLDPDAGALTVAFVDDGGHELFRKTYRD